METTPTTQALTIRNIDSADVLQQMVSALKEARETVLGGVGKGYLYNLLRPILLASSATWGRLLPSLNLPDWQNWEDVKRFASALGVDNAASDRLEPTAGKVFSAVLIDVLLEFIGQSEMGKNVEVLKSEEGRLLLKVRNLKSTLSDPAKFPQVPIAGIKSKFEQINSLAQYAEREKLADGLRALEKQVDSLLTSFDKEEVQVLIRHYAVEWERLRSEVNQLNQGEQKEHLLREVKSLDPNGYSGPMSAKKFLYGVKSDIGRLAREWNILLEPSVVIDDVVTFEEDIAVPDEQVAVPQEMVHEAQSPIKVLFERPIVKDLIGGEAGQIKYLHDEVFLKNEARIKELVADKVFLGSEITAAVDRFVRDNPDYHSVNPIFVAKQFIAEVGVKDYEMSVDDIGKDFERALKIIAAAVIALKRLPSVDLLGTLIETDQSNIEVERGDMLDRSLEITPSRPQRQTSSNFASANTQPFIPVPAIPPKDVSIPIVNQDSQQADPNDLPIPPAINLPLQQSTTGPMYIPGRIDKGKMQEVGDILDEIRRDVLGFELTSKYDGLKKEISDISNSLSSASLSQAIEKIRLLLKKSEEIQNSTSGGQTLVKVADKLRAALRGLGVNTETVQDRPEIQPDHARVMPVAKVVPTPPAMVESSPDIKVVEESLKKIFNIQPQGVIRLTKGRSLALGSEVYRGDIPPFPPIVHLGDKVTGQWYSALKSILIVPNERGKDLENLEIHLSFYVPQVIRYQDVEIKGPSSVTYKNGRIRKLGGDLLSVNVGSISVDSASEVTIGESKIIFTGLKLTSNILEQFPKGAQGLVFGPVQFDKTTWGLSEAACNVVVNGKTITGLRFENNKLSEYLQFDKANTPPETWLKVSENPL